jgi:hypothetical protein
VLAAYRAGKKDGTKVDSLFVSIVIMCTIANAIAIILLTPVMSAGFHVCTRACRCLHGVFYASCTVQEKRNKKAQLLLARAS